MSSRATRNRRTNNNNPAAAAAVDDNSIGVDGSSSSTPALYSVGTAVRKNFPDHGWFDGTILSHSEEDGKIYYHLKYEDGDEEELEENDVKKIVVFSTEQGGQQKTSNASTKKRQTDSTHDTTTTTTTTVNDELITPAKRPRRTRSAKGSSSSSSAASILARGVTPSPTLALSGGEGFTQNVTTQQEDTEKVESKRASGATTNTRKGKASTSKSAPKDEPKVSKHFVSPSALLECDDSKSDYQSENGGSDGESDLDMPLAALKQKVGAKKTGATSSSKKKKASISATSAKGRKTPANKKKDTSASSGNHDSAMEDIDGSELIMASETDSDDEKDRPFRVEYATTGRSTCRGCDERILKGEVRIASRPLFRGKPGFVVYRHLKCQILPEEIKTMSDIGGWRRLKAGDREQLKNQVEESARLIEQENEELDADELVQTAFEGETRPPPMGLVASLLPFQQEGVSWMYNQEVNGETVKGGILADEMGMGKWNLNMAASCILIVKH
jgi:hypothetical protein